MKVFKFGGASVKDVASINNITKILKSERSQKLVVVISAMGKMTNAFEKIVSNYQSKNNALDASIQDVMQYHQIIVEALFPEGHIIFKETAILFDEIRQFILNNTKTDYDYIYDQLVSYGELISTKIVSYFLSHNGIDNIWLDARKLILTDNNYRNAAINWNETCQRINTEITHNTLYITQGFIAGAYDNTTTTLGREGSDFSAAVFSHCLQAESLTIWKDVPGVYNADPRYFNQKIVLTQISYRETLEMAFYGASVIHPKTIKPLENKLIPLFVRSFSNPEIPGTIIKKGIDISPKTACYTLKTNQILLSIASKDFSFIIEQNISQLFDLFAQYKIKVNLIQNSAISFSVCIEDPYLLFDKLVKELETQFYITYNTNLRLISIRHFSQNDIEKIEKEYTILVTQQTSKTIQFVVK